MCASFKIQWLCSDLTIQYGTLLTKHHTCIDVYASFVLIQLWEIICVRMWQFLCWYRHVMSLMFTFTLVWSVISIYFNMEFSLHLYLYQASPVLIFEIGALWILARSFSVRNSMDHYLCSCQKGMLIAMHFLWLDAALFGMLCSRWPLAIQWLQAFFESGNCSSERRNIVNYPRGTILDLNLLPVKTFCAGTTSDLMFMQTRVPIWRDWKLFLVFFTAFWCWLDLSHTNLRLGTRLMLICAHCWATCLARARASDLICNPLELMPRFRHSW